MSQGYSDEDHFSAPDLAPDVLCLIFEQLVGDYKTLCDVGLVSQSWRSLSLPYLLAEVDVSCHNNPERLSQHENFVSPEVYAHYHARYRPLNLVSRQRSFLHLMVNRPSLARHVRTFTWTLVWSGDNSTPLLKIDCETWNVFSRLVNVAKVDLASISDVWKPEIVHQNPASLFSQATEIRLLGRMRRSLVKAILEVNNPSRLRSLTFDYLEDQGAMPGGLLIWEEIACEYARNARKAELHDPECFFNDHLYQDQEAGKAAILPGPMWYALKLVSKSPLISLSNLRVAIPAFDLNTDLRNYYTSFKEFASLIRQCSSTLKSLTVISGEHPSDYYPRGPICGNHMFEEYTVRPWCIKIAAAYLKHILAVLTDCPYPNLTNIVFEGFKLLEHKAAGSDLGGTRPYMENCPFTVDFTGTRHVDGRVPFTGFDC